jgi:ferrous iron transport protein A
VAKVRSIDLPEAERRRLRELGVGPNAIVQVVQCGLFRSRVIAVGSDRIAIDGRTCACIELQTTAGAVVTGFKK